MRYILLALACLTPAFAAAADMALPRFDVPTSCAKVARSGGTYSETIYSGCLDMEQQAYDDLKAKWDSLPQGIRASCVRVAKAANPSYSILSGCIDMETSAASENKTKTFRY